MRVNLKKIFYISLGFMLLFMQTPNAEASNWSKALKGIGEAGSEIAERRAEENRQIRREQRMQAYEQRLREQQQRDQREWEQRRYQEDLKRQQEHNRDNIKQPSKNDEFNRQRKILLETIPYAYLMVNSPIFNVWLANKSSKIKKVIFNGTNAAEIIRILTRFEVESHLTIHHFMQMHLKNLGYYNGDIDGVFGPSTKSAIAQYEINNQYPIMREGNPLQSFWNNR